MMDAEVLRWVITVCLGVLAWFGKKAISDMEHSVDLLKTDIQSLKDTRLHKDDFREFKLELRANFDEIKQAIRDLKTNAN